MPYSTTITALDLSGGVPDVRVVAGYTWDEAVGSTVVERRQDEVTLDVTSAAFLSQTTPVSFGYAGNLAPQPSANWFIALWIQEIPRIANDTGWLFRSGLFTTEPPSDPIEVILAPEELVGNVELASAVGALPIASGSTTITAITLTVAGADVALTAIGTDTGLPAGVTFTYTATLVLIPNASLKDVDSPFEIRLNNPSLSFTAAPGTGFATTLLNLIAGIVHGEVAPRLKATVKGLVNAGVLSTVASRLNRGTPASMPPGVVLSIRAVRSTTRSAAGGGTESVIGLRGALGAFDGVLNKFPASGGGRCFIASAALDPHAPEVVTLRTWRDERLLARPGGSALVAAYEWVSPAVARAIARSERRQAIVRRLVVVPAARLAGRSLRSWTATARRRPHRGSRPCTSCERSSPDARYGLQLSGDYVGRRAIQSGGNPW